MLTFPRRLLPVLLACVLVVVGALSAGSAWAATLAWSNPLRIDHQAPFDRQAGLRGISCPSTSLCVAVDDAGNALTATNPTGDASAWTTTHIDQGNNDLAAVSCPSTSLCVAVDRAGNIVTSTNPTGGAGAWTTTRPADGGSWSSVSCPSTSLCVVVAEGRIATSMNPAGGAGAWTSAPVAAGDLTTVSCPSTSLCVAADFNGKLMTSTNPAGGASTWSAPVDVGVSRGLSCPVSNLCVGVDDAGGIETSTNPTGGAAAWTRASVEGNELLGISCASTSLCVAIDAGGNVVTSTDPTGGAGAWSIASIDSARPYLLGGVSCAASSQCVAVDASGHVLSATNPTGGAAAWTSVAADADAANSLTGLSCPSTSFCAAVDASGNVLTSTNPAGGAGAWTVTSIDPLGSLTAISCPSASLCVAVDRGGNALTSTNPTGGAGAWSSASIAQPNPSFPDFVLLTDVACPSTTLCVVSGGNNDILTSTNPTGGAADWTTRTVSSISLLSVACPSTSLCVAGTSGLVGLVTSTNPTGDASAWASTGIDDNGFMTTVACAGTNLCLIGQDGGQASASTNPTGGTAAWSTARIDAAGFNVDLTTTACPSTTFCVALDSGGNAVTSANPAGGASAWLTRHMDDWSPAAVSCPSPSLCLAVDQGGRVLVGTPSMDNGTPPSNTARPVISGSASLGATLHASSGQWNGDQPQTYAYQWLRDSNPIPAATGSTYTVTAADQGHQLAVRSTATNASGSASADSAPLLVPEPAQPPVNTSLPRITGNPAVGSTLSASTGSWSGDEPISYAYQWLRDGSPITGATPASYTVTTADQGHQVAVRVTAKDASGSASATSAALNIPAAPPPPASVVSLGKVGVKPGAVVVQVRCSQGSGCGRVTAQLSVVEHLRHGKITAISARKRRPTTRTVVIGRASISLAAGQTTRLVVRLNRTGRALLKRYKHLKARLRLRSGGKVVGAKRVNLRQTRRR